MTALRPRAELDDNGLVRVAWPDTGEVELLSVDAGELLRTEVKRYVTAHAASAGRISRQWAGGIEVRLTRNGAAYVALLTFDELAALELELRTALLAATVRRARPPVVDARLPYAD